MKPGDKVKCVRAETTLVVGEIYTVWHCRHGIVCIDEQPGSWSMDRFELVSVTKGQAPEEDKEPSAEAFALARKTRPAYMMDRDLTWLAAALQKLMDERDGVLQTLGQVRARLNVERQRAEAAEKNLAAFRHDKDVLVSQLEARAEAAEKLNADWEQSKHRYQEEMAILRAHYEDACARTVSLFQRAEAAEKRAKILEEYRDSERAQRRAAEDRAKAAETLNVELTAALELEREMGDLHAGGATRAEKRAEAAEAEQRRLQKALDVCSVVHVHNVNLKTRAEAADAWAKRWKRLAKSYFSDAGISIKSFDELLSRAEAAEKNLLDREDEVETWRARAEAAEKHLKVADSAQVFAENKYLAALASEAQLIREVREWNRIHKGTVVRWQGLENVLTRHEQGTAEHPDTARLRELVRRVRAELPDVTARLMLKGIES